MKKLIILLVSITVVGGLVYIAFDLMNKQGKSDSELIEFGYEDVSHIDKIIISDPYSHTFEVQKQENGEWVAPDGSCIQQTNVEFILDAFRNIQFKGYLPEGAKKEHIKRMSAHNTKVEIFEDGEWSKTWYIGNATMDHYGQIMLLDSREYGKSENPVIMKLRNLKGIIEPRFFADPRKWLCTDMISLNIDKIKKIDVSFKKQPVRSFSVENNNRHFVVKQNGKVLENIDTSMVFRYLNNFEDLNFNSPNYSLNERQVDSVKQSQPFCVLTVTETGGKTTRYPMFTIPSEDESVNEFGNVVNTNNDKFWCLLPNGQLVKCQYFHFDPVLRGHVYFPMDLSSITVTENK